MEKSKFECLLDKSVHAALSAIEIYNKPDFKYREESFSILMVNAWELLLKSKILKDNNNEITCLYCEMKPEIKNGSNSINFKKNRCGNYLTIDIYSALTKLNIDIHLKGNLEILIEIRDNSIHFFNERDQINKTILEIGCATLGSYVKLLDEWFNFDLSKYNFFLMPISFYHPENFRLINLNNRNQSITNLLSFIHQKEKEVENLNSEHNIRLLLEMKPVKVKSEDAISYRIANDDPNAIPITYNSEDKFIVTYTWSYKDDLLPNLKKRYCNLKFDNNFRTIIRELEKDKRFCDKRYLDIKKKEGTAQKFYNPNILNEFDNHYNKN